MVANAQEFYETLDNDTAIADDFLKHCSALFQMLTAQQEAGEKAPLRYVTMSFLKSSVITETYEIAITCHSVDLYMDETETEVYWRMDFMRDMVDNDMKRIAPRIKEEIIRTYNHEIEDFRYYYAQTYTALLLTFFSRFLHRIFELPEFLAVQKEKQVDVSFGGYMEKAVPLIQYEKEIA